MEPVLNTDRMTAFEYACFLREQQIRYGNLKPEAKPESTALANAFRQARKKQNVTLKTI